MKLHQLKSLLRAHPTAFPRFILPDGEQIPAHFHLTEVGYVAKKFVDGCLIDARHRFDRQSNSLPRPYEQRKNQLRRPKPRFADEVSEGEGAADTTRTV